jgi:hypothetical protein
MKGICSPPIEPDIGKEPRMEQSEKGKDVLPELTDLQGLTVTDPLDLLDAEERATVREELDRLAHERREAEAASGTLRLG